MKCATSAERLIYMENEMTMTPESVVETEALAAPFDNGRNSKFEVLTTDGRARRGVLHTVHGDIQTPVFMNVGTCAAIALRDKSDVTALSEKQITEAQSMIRHGIYAD